MIVVKKTIDVVPKLIFDAGDITTIRPYLPEGLTYSENINDVQFNGDLDELNWI